MTGTSGWEGLEGEAGTVARGLAGCKEFGVLVQSDSPLIMMC